MWRLNGTLKNTFELHANDVNALVALPDNQHALSASHDSTIKLFNVNDGAVLRTFGDHHLPLRSLALLPDGLRFVSGSDDHTARIWEHGLALAPTTTSSEIKLLLKGAEAELRLAQEAAQDRALGAGASAAGAAEGALAPTEAGRSEVGATARR